MEGWGQMGRNMCEVPSNRIVTSIETFSQNHLHRRPSASYVMRQFTITCCGQIIANSEFAQTVMREICSGLIGPSALIVEVVYLQRESR